MAFNPESPHIVYAAEEVPAPGYLPPFRELSRHVAGIGFLGGRAIFDIQQTGSLQQTEAITLAKTLAGFTPSEVAEQQFSSVSEVHGTIQGLNRHFGTNLYTHGALHELAQPERGVLMVSKIADAPKLDGMLGVDTAILSYISAGLSDIEVARKLRMDTDSERNIEDRLYRLFGHRRRNVLALGGVMMGLNGLKPNEYAHLDEAIAAFTEPSREHGRIRYYAEYLG